MLQSNENTYAVWPSIQGKILKNGSIIVAPLKSTLFKLQFEKLTKLTSEWDKFVLYISALHKLAFAIFTYERSSL